MLIPIKHFYEWEDIKSDFPSAVSMIKHHIVDKFDHHKEKKYCGQIGGDCNQYDRDGEPFGILEILWQCYCPTLEVRYFIFEVIQR